MAAWTCNCQPHCESMGECHDPRPVPDTGYHSCSCRDCFGISIGEPGALCGDCQAAGCVSTDGCDGLGCGRTHECLVPGAYGTDADTI